MEVATVGNGAIQSKNTDCTSFLLANESGHMLLDCGPGTVRNLQGMSISLASIETILISHQHGDHIAEFAYLTFMINRELRILGNRKALNVIALPMVHDILTAMLDSQYPAPAISHITINPIDAKLQRVSEHDVFCGRVTTVPVSHSVPAIGARIDVGGQSVSYSADTEFSQTFTDLALGTSILLHQAIGSERHRDVARAGKHSTAFDAGTSAQRSGAKALLMFHPLPEAMDHNEELLEEAASAYDGSIALPRAGHRISLL